MAVERMTPVDRLQWAYMAGFLRPAPRVKQQPGSVPGTGTRQELDRALALLEKVTAPLIRQLEEVRERESADIDRLAELCARFGELEARVSEARLACEQWARRHNAGREVGD